MKAAHAVAGWWGVQLKSAWEVGADGGAFGCNVVKKGLQSQ